MIGINTKVNIQETSDTEKRLGSGAVDKNWVVFFSFYKNSEVCLLHIFLFFSYLPFGKQAHTGFECQGGITGLLGL